MPAVNYAAKLHGRCLPDHDEAVVEKSDAIYEDHQQAPKSDRLEKLEGE